MNIKSKREVIESIKTALKSVGEKRLTRKRFLEMSDIKLSDIFRYFPKWSDALEAAGADYEPYHQKIAEADLLTDWGNVARKLGHIPTRNQYKLKGYYSPGVFERNFGPWSSIPESFKDFANDSDQWKDVLDILPTVAKHPNRNRNATMGSDIASIRSTARWHDKLSNRPIYGDPIDFRGLRHVPVNEQGVVFLFGMVARELGYLVEAIQGGFPDCEAKRQVARGQWQPVRIEFEYESKNFADHGHDPNMCDIIVCWQHNWDDCPAKLEVVELSQVIKNLSMTDE